MRRALHISFLLLVAAVLALLPAVHYRALAASEQPTLLIASGPEAQLPSAIGCAPDHATFWASSGGALVSFESGADERTNAGWHRLFADKLPSNTPLIAQCSSSLTLGAVYARVQQRIDRAGQIYEARSETTAPNGALPTSTVLRAELQRDLTRTETTVNASTYTSIATMAGTYTLDSSGAISIGTAPSCPGASLVVGVLLECPNATFETYVFEQGQPRAIRSRPTVRIEDASLSSGPAVRIVAERQVQPYRSGSFHEIKRVYLDLASFTPTLIEVEHDGVLSSRRVISGSFIASDQLPGSAFEPASLRALRPDPLRALDTPAVGYGVRWLGLEYSGAAHIPPLTLWHVSRYDGGDQHWDADQVMLEYTPRADTYGQQLLLRLTEYSRATWARIPASTFGPPDHCWTSAQIALPDGTATVLAGFNWPDGVPAGPNDPCPTDRPRDRFSAQVLYTDAAIVVAPWDWPEQSLDGVLELVRALAQR